MNIYGILAILSLIFAACSANRKEWGNAVWSSGMFSLNLFFIANNYPPPF